MWLFTFLALCFVGFLKKSVFCIDLATLNELSVCIYMFNGTVEPLNTLMRHGNETPVFSLPHQRSRVWNRSRL